MDEHTRALWRDIYAGNERFTHQTLSILLRGSSYKEIARFYSETIFRGYLTPLQHTASAICRVIAAPDRHTEQAFYLAEKISSRLDACNRKRRTRLLDHQQIAAIIATTHREDRYASVLGGSVYASYGYNSFTTAALCFRPFRSRSLYLDIAECPAAAASMGRCWQVLQPWFSRTMTPGVEARRLNNLETWAQQPDRIRIPRYLASLVSDLLYNYWRSDGSPDAIIDILEFPADFLRSRMDHRAFI